jgi:hypothetical protein
MPDQDDDGRNDPSAKEKTRRRSTTFDALKINRRGSNPEAGDRIR